MAEESSAPREIVIIRRRGGGEDEGHHGGAWKIAFADFMTAMMAFFLVMWLINATDKETVTQIATYFNPLRLSDKTTSTRGVHDLSEENDEKKNEVDKGKSKDKGKSDKKSEAKTSGKKHDSNAAGGKASPQDEASQSRRFTDEELFSDPYGVLAKLAVQALNPSAALGPGALKAFEEREGRGDAFRDPFDPATWRATKMPRSVDGAQQSQESMKSPVPSIPDQAAGPVAASSEAAVAAKPEGEGKDLSVGEAPAASKPEKMVAGALQATEARNLEAEIAQAIRLAAPRAHPSVDVKWTPEGMLISLTDKSDYGMFAIASAEPRPEMVVLMGSIAKLLVSRSGKVIIRGHTDSRPYKRAGYDNWRLSSDRAQVARYMLVRGGIAESRVERIEGYADQRPRYPEDPEAAQNRRIEILLRMDDL